jgi:segregation and condensation protein B
MNKKRKEEKMSETEKNIESIEKNLEIQEDKNSEKQEENEIENQENNETENQEDSHLLKQKQIEDLDEEREKEYLRKIESALFVSGKWISLQDLVMLTNINPILLRMLIKKLKEDFTLREGAIEIFEKKDLWKMDIKNEYLHIAGKLATGRSEFTKAEQETLAIIAYKQPIKQSVVVNIRGNKAYDNIKKFKELGLVRTKRQGHTYELSLNDDFYEYFSLKDEEELDLIGKE